MTEKILTTHVGSLIRPPELLQFIAKKQNGLPFDQSLYEKTLRESVAAVVKRQVEAGIDIPERRRVRQGDQLVAVRPGPHERLHAPAGEARRARLRARRGPGALRGVLQGARCGRRPAGGGECDRRDRGVHGSGEVHGAGGAAARHRQLQGGAGEGGGEAGLPAGRGAGERHTRPRQRALQVGRGPAGRDRGGDAHRVQGDRRRGPVCAARRRAPCRHLRPHGAAEDLRGVQELGGAAGRAHQPRARGDPRGPRALPRVLGKLARPAHHRRAAEEHRRRDPEGARGDLSDRRSESAARARVASLERREDCPPGRKSWCRRDQPRHQRGGAPGTGRRAGGAAREARRPART